MHIHVYLHFLLAGKQTKIMIAVEMHAILAVVESDIIKSNIFFHVVSSFTIL